MLIQLLYLIDHIWKIKKVIRLRLIIRVVSFVEKNVLLIN